MQFVPIGREPEGQGTPGGGSSLVEKTGASADGPSGGPKELSLSAEDQHRLEVLREILARKRDNDPRLDTELRYLSPALKQALQREYDRTEPEKLNDRGTIVFLLGRNLEAESDFQFMKAVIESPVCRSFSDCSKDPARVAEEDTHHEPMDAITLSYPQWNALLAIENWVNSRSWDSISNEQRQYLMQVIESAMRSPNLSIANRARSLHDQIRQ